MSGGALTTGGVARGPRRTREITDSSTSTVDAAGVRKQLDAIAWTRVVLLALAATSIVFISVNLLKAGGIASSAGAGLSFGIAAVVGVTAATALRWRTGRISELRAALWMEEQVSSGFARVALAEDSASGNTLLTPAQRATMQRAPNIALEPALVRNGLRSVIKGQVLAPALFLITALLLVVYQAYWQRTLAASYAGATAGTAASAGDTKANPPIGQWRVRLIPPAYTGLKERSLGDASSLSALAGSTIEIAGDGSVPAFAVRLLSDSAVGAASRTDRTPVVTTRENAWRTTVSVPPAPLELRASRGGASRLLLVDGYADSIPHVTLRKPERDSVLRRATGRLPLHAVAHDDIGLRTASFELIVSSGEGERFTARTVTIGAQRLTGSKDRDVHFALDLDALALGPGDVVHLRAVARDGNRASGREAGSSETRSFRVARASEYDSVAVEPAPPPAVDSSLLSQRMLLMLTERLEKRRPTLARPVLVGESGRLAKDQARLRQAIGNLVFQRLSGEQGAEHAHTVGDGHDHGVDLVGGKLALSGREASGNLDEGEDSPIISINRPLLEAYNAMWDAGRALEQADTREAIPFMKLALVAIERARTASRYYLRGKPPTVIVDIAKVRLSGKDTGSTNNRTSRIALPLRDALRERRLLSAASLLQRDAGAARDSLAVLRLESVGESPAFADALTAALDALGAGTDVTAALVRARRALGGVVRTPGSLWSRPGTP